MGAETLIRLTKPLTHNRRILGFVVVALLISGIMALVYHLQIKANQENFYLDGNMGPF